MVLLLQVREYIIFMITETAIYTYKQAHHCAIYMLLIITILMRQLSMQTIHRTNKVAHNTVNV